MTEKIIHTQLSKDEVLTTLKLLLETRFPTIELNTVNGVNYLNSRPLEMKGLITRYLHNVWNPITMEIELIPSAKGTEIRVRSSTNDLIIVISSMAGGLLWFSALGFAISGLISPWLLVIATLVPPAIFIPYFRSIKKKERLFLQCYQDTMEKVQPKTSTNDSN